MTPAARRRFDRAFGFSPDLSLYDWEIELADGCRVREFFDAYLTIDMSDDERFALMSLIVASADHALEDHQLSDEEWQKIFHALVADASILASMIYYWCCADGEFEDECFTLTSRMRTVWDAAFGDHDPMPAMPEGGEP